MTPAARARRTAYAFYATAFCNGALLASIGPTLDALSEQTGSSTSRISLLFAANGVGFVAGSLFGGRLFGRVNGTAALAVTVVAMAAFIATIPIIGALWPAMVAFGVVGFGVGIGGVGTNTLVLWLFQRRAAPFINALHLSFGLGAFSSPLIVDRFAVATDDPATAFWFFAALMIPVAIWLAKSRGPDHPEQVTRSGIGAGLSGNAVFLVLVAALFVMHVGGQLAFGGWIFSYASELGFGGQTSARVLNSVFWGGLVIGRLIAIPVSLRLSSRAMMHLDLIGAVVSIGVIGLLSDSSLALWIGTAGFGMSVASMYATGINYTGEHIPVTSEAMSALIVGAGLGSMTLPWLTGQFFDRQGPESMLWVVGSAMAAAALLFVWLQLHTARDGEQR